MSEGKKYYCFCSSNCKYETMTKEQIFAAIMQAAESGEIGDVDAGFITKVKETNAGGYVTFWTGTQAQFNALPSIDTNCLYLFLDDTSVEDMAAAINDAVKAAQEAAKNKAVIDISDKITLTPSCSAVAFSVLEVTQKKFVYDPNAGIVHFSFTLKTGNTQDVTLTAGSAIYVDQTGGYTAKEGYTHRAFDSRFQYDCRVVQHRHFLIAAKDISGFTKTGGETTFSGWYFCDGEE